MEAKVLCGFVCLSLQIITELQLLHKTLTAPILLGLL